MCTHYSFSLLLVYFLKSPFKMIVTTFFPADPLRTRKCKSCVFIFLLFFLLQRGIQWLHKTVYLRLCRIKQKKSNLIFLLKVLSPTFLTFLVNATRWDPWSAIYSLVSFFCIHSKRVTTPLKKGGDTLIEGERRGDTSSYLTAVSSSGKIS